MATLQVKGHCWFAVAVHPAPSALHLFMELVLVEEEEDNRKQLFNLKHVY